MQAPRDCRSSSHTRGEARCSRSLSRGSQSVHPHSLQCTAVNTAIGRSSSAEIRAGPAAWYGKDLSQRPEEWSYQLSEAEVEELDHALALIHPLNATEEQLLNGEGILEITPQNFSLPTLGPKLRQLREQIVNGRGFHVIKGVPVWRYSKWQCAAAFYGLGCYLGDAVSQNATGHLLGHVKDTGGDPSKP